MILCKKFKALSALVDYLWENRQARGDPDNDMRSENGLWFESSLAHLLYQNTSCNLIQYAMYRQDDATSGFLVERNLVYQDRLTLRKLHQAVSRKSDLTRTCALDA